MQRFARYTARFTMMTLLGCAGTWLTGCSRAVTETTVHANGSWTRKITFHGPKSNPNDGPNANNANGNNGNNGNNAPQNGNQDFNPFGSLMPKLEDVVRVPSGPGWKITRPVKDEESVIVAERTLQPGETLHGDIAIKAIKEPEPLNFDIPGNGNPDAKPDGKNPNRQPVGKGNGKNDKNDKKDKFVMVNDVSVKQTAPGVWKYTEVLHWIGPPMPEMTLDSTAMTTVKEALPPALATDANVKEVTRKFTLEFLRVLFGPGDPLLSDIFTFMMQPELMERRIMKRMGSRLDTALKEKFGAQMTAEQRLGIVRRIVASATNMVGDKGKAQGPGGPGGLGNAGKPGDNESGAGSVALFLSVKMPGRITETNGERDEVQGDVYWAVYPMATVLGDITLTATCNTNPQASK